MSGGAPRPATLVGFGVVRDLKPDKRPLGKRQRARDDRQRPDRRRLLPLDARPRQCRGRYGPYSPPRAGAARRGAAARPREAARARSARTPRPACCSPGVCASRARGELGAGRGWCATALSAACDWAAVGAAGGPGTCSDPSALVPASAMVAMAAAPVACSAIMPIASWPGARRASAGDERRYKRRAAGLVGQCRPRAVQQGLDRRDRCRLAARELLVAAALELAADQRGALRARQALDRVEGAGRGARPARRPRRPTARRRAARAAAGPSASPRGSSRGSGCARWRTATPRRRRGPCRR